MASAATRPQAGKDAHHHAVLAPSRHQQHKEDQLRDLEADQDAETTKDSGMSDLTVSITSSVMDYQFEHGRRYHAYQAGKYFMPNDDRENRRLDWMHELITMVLGDSLFLSPLQTDKIKRVLDVGTGNGVWAIQFGEDFPDAEIIGNDLSPTQPEWVPENVRFEVDDVESDWIYPFKFDFIFCRCLSMSISDWPKLIGSMYDSLTPGGWVEFGDPDYVYRSDDGTLPPAGSDDQPGSSFHAFATQVTAGSAQMGKDPFAIGAMPDRLADAGFVNVTHRRYKIPVGPWCRGQALKRIGNLNLLQTLEGLEAFGVRILCDVRGWSEAEAHALFARMRTDLAKSGIHAYWIFHVVYAQKPEEPTPRPS